MVVRGIVQFRPTPDVRLRLRRMADQLQRARLSAFNGRPLIAFVIPPEDRDFLVEVLKADGRSGGCVMKTKIYALTFAILLTLWSSCASANELQLPAQMVGTWCHTGHWGDPIDERQTSYWRPADREDCGNRGGMVMAQQTIQAFRFERLGSLCKIVSVKFSRKAQPMPPLYTGPGPVPPYIEQLLVKGAELTDIYAVRTSCEAEDGETKEYLFEIQAGEYLATWDWSPES
jgi:hypothetical protein